MRDIRQFKLVNDDEIVCEVVEWDDSSTSNMIVRNVLRLDGIEDGSGQKLYIFKPWLALQENLAELQMINADQILSVANPSKYLMEYYDTAIENVSNIELETEYDFTDELYETLDSSGDNIVVH